MPRKVFVFANPIAGRGKGKLYAQSIADGLSRAGFDVTVGLKNLHTVSSSDLAGIAGAAAVVAIGGDGTLRAVTHRVLRECGDASPDCPPMLVVPMGTANLMGKHLGIAWSEKRLGDEIAAAIKAGKMLDLDAAVVRATDYDSTGPTKELFVPFPLPKVVKDRLGQTVGSAPTGTREELLLLVAGVGIDAKVVHELARVRKGPISYASYALPAALALGTYHYPTIRVDVDGKTAFAGQGIALVGNVREYGTGFPVLPHARPDDGLLDVCALPCRSPADLARLFLQAAAGEHLHAEGAVYVKGKSVRIDADQPVELQIDGDAAGYTPAQIELSPRRMPFIVP